MKELKEKLFDIIGYGSNAKCALGKKISSESNNYYLKML